MNWFYLNVYHPVQHWLAYATGSYNVPSVPHNYGFFSGSGSDISEITLFLAVFSLFLHAYRVHNCEVTGCWRVGRHDTAAGHTVCRKHHPDSHLSVEAVLAAHEKALKE